MRFRANTLKKYEVAKLFLAKGYPLKRVSREAGLSVAALVNLRREEKKGPLQVSPQSRTPQVRIHKSQPPLNGLVKVTFDIHEVTVTLEGQAGAIGKVLNPLIASAA